ncbi:RHTO0S24e02036g1_1 [Rhodotorula toruloides]|uniref:RHTO0S24e02036g1_1 n=2 Tax=Rhodotorula toruloides TaxID=5286 RepID=A0A061BQB0_RHOTO|nr:zinc finger, C2H2-type protein, transcription factor [Rhodotorula toruloides NP11]EMS19291.1 zinc finger, C2H2-type protein, transcription factor [Rhodotorula toruloides NP11]CDR49260.1 RHTO0S24e02036g1_1 [Rhodotorula toruloides]
MNGALQPAHLRYCNGLDSVLRRRADSLTSTDQTTSHAMVFSTPPATDTSRAARAGTPRPRLPSIRPLMDEVDEVQSSTPSTRPAATPALRHATSLSLFPPSGLPNRPLLPLPEPSPARQPLTTTSPFDSPASLGAFSSLTLPSARQRPPLAFTGYLIPAPPPSVAGGVAIQPRSVSSGAGHFHSTAEQPHNLFPAPPPFLYPQIDHRQAYPSPAHPPIASTSTLASTARPSLGTATPLRPRLPRASSSSSLSAYRTVSQPSTSTPQPQPPRPPPLVSNSRLSPLTIPSDSSPSSSTTTSPVSLAGSTSTLPTTGGVLPKKYVCEVCATAFARRNDLVRHFRGHTGETPFECRKCGAKFKRSDARKRHEAKGTC